MRGFWRSFFVIAAATALSGCGGGGDKPQVSAGSTTPAATQGAGAVRSADTKSEFSGEKPGAVLATYNGKPITEAMVDRYWHPVKAQLTRNGATIPAEVMERNRRTYLERVIDEFAQIDEAGKRGITVEAGFAEGQLAALKGRGDSALMRSLESRGLSEEDFVDIQTRTRMVSQLKQQVLPTLVAENDPAIEAYYKANTQKYRQPPSVTVSLIQLSIPKDTSEADEKKIEKKAGDIRKKAASGGDFAKLAEENSDHPTSKSGGKLAPLYEGRPGIQSDLSNQAFALKKPGDVSPVFKASNAFYILKLEASTPESVRTLDEVKNQILVLLRNQKYQEWIKELRSKADIKITG